MSSIKKPHRYPEAFESLFEAAIKHPQELSFRTWTLAARQRREFYNYRYSLRREAKRNPEPRLLLLLQRANRLCFRIHRTALLIGEAHRLNEEPHVTPVLTEISD